MNRTIYVKDTDRDLWDTCSEQADRMRIPMSEYIARALHSYLHNQPLTTRCSTCDEIRALLDKR